MGNVIGRLFYPFTALPWAKRSPAFYKSSDTARSDNLDVTSTDAAVINLNQPESFTDIGSGVDTLMITCVDYWKIQILLTEIAEKQFEKAYEQALILKSSGNLVRLTHQSPVICIHCTTTSTRRQHHRER